MTPDAWEKYPVLKTVQYFICSLSTINDSITYCYFSWLIEQYKTYTDEPQLQATTINYTANTNSTDYIHKSLLSHLTPPKYSLLPLSKYDWLTELRFYISLDTK